MFLWFMQPDIQLTLITLTFLEIILGVDNIIFLPLVAAKLPLSQQNMARKLSLDCAMIARILLLVSTAWPSHATQPLFTVLTLKISFRTSILLGGGLFLIYKAMQEICEELSPAQEDEHDSGSRQLSLRDAIVQVMLLNIVFSPDSVITAVGLSQHMFIMIAAVIIAVSVMMFAAKTVGDSVSATPSIEILVSAFLLFVGVLLVADSLSTHIVREYLCFAISFSLSVETLNIIRERKNKKVSTLTETHESHSH